MGPTTALCNRGGFFSNKLMKKGAEHTKGIEFGQRMSNGGKKISVKNIKEGKSNQTLGGTMGKNYARLALMWVA